VEITVSIFDRFKPKTSAPKGSAEINVEFRRSQYDNPVEQIMFILGFKHDPKYATTLHAIADGANPGIIDAFEQLSIYGAIEANLRACAKTVQKLRDEIRAELPPALKYSGPQISDQ
jgi:hypothetical protein